MNMIPENRIPTHPGEILSEEFLAPLGIPQTQLAAKLGISVQRVNELVNGKRGVTPETAWLLAGAFGTSPQFWTNLQAAYDLAKARPEHQVKPISGRDIGLRKGMVLVDERGLERTVAAVSKDQSPWVFFTSGEKLLAYEVKGRMTEKDAA
jgi:antitoxin HigA-1